MDNRTVGEKVTKVAKGDSVLSWQNELAKQFDDMVDSFLGFPDSIPKTFQDYQFARHLIWKICDNRRHFRRLFVDGIRPYELEHLWNRLQPYITDTDNYMANRTKFIAGMYQIAYSCIMDSDFNMDRLMDRIVALLREIRSAEMK